MSMFARQSPGLPFDWAEPGTTPRPGILPRISTVDPHSPDQRAKSALLEAAAVVRIGAQRGVADREMVEAARVAMAMAQARPATEAQVTMRGRVVETAKGHAARVEPTDGSILTCLCRGLQLMAHGVVCRVDH